MRAQHVHHLYGYKGNETLRLELRNGVSLCKECHEAYHDQYGKTNPTPETFMRYAREFDERMKILMSRATRSRQSLLRS
jgi:hypothetical protein